MAATARRRSIAVGFVGALVVLAVLFWLVGAGDVLTALRLADPAVLVLIAVVTAVWMLAWSLALRTVLGILDIRISVWQAVLVFAATVFANNVTPFGQAGGEPVSALLISNVADSEYETSLAAVVSLDALKLLPPIGLALMGMGYYAATVTLSDRLEDVAFALIAVCICLPLVGLALWNLRHSGVSIVARVLAPVIAVVGRLVPRWQPPDAADLERRVRGFVASLERITDDPRDVAIALSLVAAGWLALIVCLWLSLVALGFFEPHLFAAALIALPLGSLAAVTPFPGGLGGMEAAFVAVLTPISGLPASTVSAAVVLFRVASYWLPTLIGGAATSAFGSTARW